MQISHGVNNLFNSLCTKIYEDGVNDLSPKQAARILYVLAAYESNKWIDKLSEPLLVFRYCMYVCMYVSHIFPSLHLSDLFMTDLAFFFSISKIDALLQDGAESLRYIYQSICHLHAIGSNKSPLLTAMLSNTDAPKHELFAPEMVMETKQLQSADTSVLIHGDINNMITPSDGLISSEDIPVLSSHAQTLTQESSLLDVMHTCRKETSVV